jgi:hypothetical protein
MGPGRRAAASSRKRLSAFIDEMRASVPADTSSARSPRHINSWRSSQARSNLRRWVADGTSSRRAAMSGLHALDARFRRRRHPHTVRDARPHRTRARAAAGHADLARAVRRPTPTALARHAGGRDHRARLLAGADAQEVGRLVGEDWTAMETFVRRARGADPEAVIRPEATRRDRRRPAGRHQARHPVERARPVLRRRFPPAPAAAFAVRSDRRRDAHGHPQAGSPRLCRRARRTRLAAEACVFVDDQAKQRRPARLPAGMRAVHFDVRDAPFRQRKLCPFRRSPIAWARKHCREDRTCVTRTS